MFDIWVHVVSSRFWTFLSTKKEQILRIKQLEKWDSATQAKIVFFWKLESFSGKKVWFVFKVVKGGNFDAQCVSNGIIFLKIANSAFYKSFYWQIWETSMLEKAESIWKKECFHQKKTKSSHPLKALCTKKGKCKLCQWWPANSFKPVWNWLENFEAMEYFSTNCFMTATLLWSNLSFYFSLSFFWKILRYPSHLCCLLAKQRV